MRHERVLAVDPGKLTGAALMVRLGDEVSIIWSAELNVYSTSGAEKLRSEIKGWDQHDDTLLRVVIEKFTITPETGRKSQEASWALRTTGAVELMCVEAGYPLDAIVWQTPAAAKNAFPNPKLKRLGLWHRGGAGHALDAIRHASLYLVTSGWTDSRMA